MLDKEEDSEEDPKNNTCCFSIVNMLKQQLSIVLKFLFWCPLILTSLIYKIGVLILYVVYLGSIWAALGMTAAIFLVNLVSTFLLR